MYKIDSNDEDLQKAVEQLFEWYDEYLSKDLKKVLEKIRDTKPDNLTDDEGETLRNAYNIFEGLKETIGEITEIMGHDEGEPLQNAYNIFEGLKETIGEITETMAQD